MMLRTFLSDQYQEHHESWDRKDIATNGRKDLLHVPHRRLRGPGPLRQGPVSHPGEAYTTGLFAKQAESLL